MYFTHEGVRKVLSWRNTNSQLGLLFLSQMELLGIVNASVEFVKETKHNQNLETKQQRTEKVGGGTN